MSQSALLARRLQENWVTRHPHDACHSGLSLDDSLTSLGWLQNLRVSEFTQHRPASNSGAKQGNDRNLIKPDVGTVLQTSVKEEFSDDSSFTDIDYKTNLYAKPPFSYASLICMALRAAKSKKLTLASIYNWITENFVYYRHSDPSWQNSIRHNLSLNKCFEKVPRRKDEPGKGGFWRINPEYCDLIQNGVLKKRPGNTDTIPSPPLKRFKPEDEEMFTACDSRRRTLQDKLLSNCSTDFDANDEDSAGSLSLSGDLNWTTILNQDIVVGGKAIKTEDILDECENSPLLSIGPPSSETTSDDLGLDFFSQTDFNMNLPVDFQTNDPLDLSVQGTTIRAPDWWAPDDNNNVANVSSSYYNNVVNVSSSYYNNVVNVSSSYNSGLNTPVPTSTESDHGEIIWGESLKLGSSGNSFDLDSLFALDRMSSPKQG